jgi:hypothetical protein
MVSPRRGKIVRAAANDDTGDELVERKVERRRGQAGARETRSHPRYEVSSPCGESGAASATGRLSSRKSAGTHWGRTKPHQSPSMRTTRATPSRPVHACRLGRSRSKVLKDLRKISEMSCRRCRGSGQHAQLQCGKRRHRLPSRRGCRVFISYSSRRHRRNSAATCDHSARIQPRRNKIPNTAFKS